MCSNVFEKEVVQFLRILTIKVSETVWLLCGREMSNYLGQSPFLEIHTHPFHHNTVLNQMNLI
jgi:hypothetical protein